MFYKLPNIGRRHNERRVRPSSWKLLYPSFAWHRKLAACSLLGLASAVINGQQATPGMTSHLRLQDSTHNQLPLSYLVEHSAIIFAGQVINTERSYAQSWITVRFDVTTGIRGAPPGIFVAKFIEDGPGSFPLRPGERVVAFLNARNAYGLTSFFAKNCGIFERSGADRLDLRRLQQCPGPGKIPAMLSPAPSKLWPDLQILTTAIPYTVSLAPNEERLAPSQLLKVLPASSTSMETGQFLSTISEIARSPTSEPYAIDRRDLPGFQ